MAKGAYIGVDGKARKIKKGYIGVENFAPRALPSGYTQVEYIQSSGTQYIDTGFKPNQNTRLTMEISFDTMVQCAPYGVRHGAKSNAFNVFQFPEGHIRFDYGTEQKDIARSSVAGTKYHIDHNATSCAFGDSSASFSAQTFTCSYNLALLAINTAGTISNYAKAKLYSCQIHDNGTLIRDYVPCKNASGVAGLYDMVNNTFSGSATSSAFIAGSSALSVARKIKKAYIGIGGVARPCWSGGELVYYGKITSLSQARRQIGAASTGNYAVFAGGFTGGYANTVDAYSETLTRTTATALRQARYNIASTTFNNLAVFGGGYSNTAYAYIETFDKSLTKTNRTDLYRANKDLAATATDKYVVFAGGTVGNSIYNETVAYNASFTRTLPTALGKARHLLSAATVGQNVVFAGGRSDTSVATTTAVDAYNYSLTKVTIKELSAARSDLAATSVGDYMVVAGGYNQTESYGTSVDAYDKSLTKVSVAQLGTIQRELAGVSLGGFAVFGGGTARVGNASGITGIVTTFDESLTMTVAQPLSVPRRYISGTTVGNYALFGGGHSSSGYEATVEAYTVV